MPDFLGFLEAHRRSPCAQYSTAPPAPSARASGPRRWPQRVATVQNGTANILSPDQAVIEAKPMRRFGVIGTALSLVLLGAATFGYAQKDPQDQKQGRPETQAA